MSPVIDIGHVTTLDILSAADPDSRLSLYLDLLLAENQRVNLVSRALIGETDKPAEVSDGNKRVADPVSRETLGEACGAGSGWSDSSRYPAGLLGILAESLLPFYYTSKIGEKDVPPPERTICLENKTPDRCVSRETHPLGALSQTGVSRFLDIGSGGGLPSLPIIMTQSIESAVLVERTQKKAKALERMIAALHLHAKVLPQNLGECSFSTKFDLISMRYVKLDRQLLSVILSLLKPDGLFLYYSEPDEGILPSNCTTKRFCFRLDSSPTIKHFTVIHN